MWTETIARGFGLTQFTIVTNMEGISYEQSLFRPISETQIRVATVPSSQQASGSSR